MANDFDDIDDIDLNDLIGSTDIKNPAEIIDVNSASPSYASNEQYKIKKIKIKKMVKKPVAAPVEDNVSNESDYAPKVSQGDKFDLDSYLDGATENNDNQNTYYEEPLKNPIAKVDYNEKFERELPPRFINENDLTDNKSKLAFLDGEPLPRKTAVIAMAVMFLVGFFFAKMFFAEEKVVQHGLQGVVTNEEVPKGRARCGVAEKIQGCVLYIMNPQRQELSARDFYDLAAQLTGRQKFVIETGNMRYASTKIRPGSIVMLNIPPLQ